MYGLIVSAFNFILGFIFKTLVIKFLVFTALFVIVSEFVPVILNMLPSTTNIVTLVNQLPDPVWYFMNLFSVITGLKIIISSLLTRFIIRRIPIVG